MRISHQLTGFDVTKPQSVAICIMNQSSTPATSSRAPRCWILAVNSDERLLRLTMCHWLEGTKLPFVTRNAKVCYGPRGALATT